MLLGPVVRPSSAHVRSTWLHRVGNKPLTDVWTTGLSVWWVWCWGQSLSLPESVHIWAATTSGTIKTANKRNVGQADESSNVMTEHVDWINALMQRWSNESYVGAEAHRRHNKGRMCGHKVNSKWILISDTNKLCCVYFLPLSRKFRTLPEW